MCLAIFFFFFVRLLLLAGLFSGLMGVAMWAKMKEEEEDEEAEKN